MRAQATRRAGHPRKLLDEIIAACGVTIIGRREGRDAALMEEWYEEERVDTAGVTKILVRLYTSGGGGAGAAAAAAVSGRRQGREQLIDADEIWSAAAEVADAVVKMGAWSDYASSIAISDLSNQLCVLPSFRALQKRIQVHLHSFAAASDADATTTSTTSTTTVAAVAAADVAVASNAAGCTTYAGATYRRSRLLLTAFLFPRCSVSSVRRRGSERCRACTTASPSS